MTVETQTTSSLDLDSLRQKVESSLYFFAKGILGYDWLVPHIHGPLCSRLENPLIKRRGIILPRGWLKTTLCTVAYPMWRSIKNPNIRCLVTQNSATNAVKKLSIIRGQWEENNLLKAMYPELLPRKDSAWRADAACLTRTQSYPEATYEAAGTNTKVVSRHYDLIVEDDTVAPDVDELGVESLAPSYEDVEQAIGWHRLATPLLNNPMTDDILVVGTRWYDFDLLSWVMENEPQYDIITRACRENEEGLPDPTGEITYPERFNEEVLREVANSLGPYLFSCLYMNTPVRKEDMLFKPEWIKYYETAPPPQSCITYTTVDPATDPKLSKGKDIDYSVVMTCAKDLTRGHVYVLEYTQKRCNPGELVQEIFRHVIAYRPILVGYEDVAFQRSLDYWLKELMREQNMFFILEPIKRGGARGKDAGIQGLQPIFASGSIFIRNHMKELESELLQYPLGRHDDVIDALGMQTQLWKNTPQAEPYKVDDVDPFTLEGAVAEIRSQRSSSKRGPTSDPFYVGNGTIRNELVYGI